MRAKIASAARRRLTLGAVTAAALGVTAACGSTGSSTSASTNASAGGSGSHVVTIGMVTELTGTDSDIGEASLGGLKAAVYQVNKAGGVTVGGTRYTFRVVVQDDQSNPSQAGLAVQTLIRNDNVKFLFGPNTTPLFEAAVPVAYGANVLLSSVAYIAGADLTKAGPVAPYTYVFADLPGAEPISAGTVNGALKLWPGIKTASILFPDNASYDLETGIIESALKQGGVTVLTVLRYDPSTTDFSPLLTKIKSGHPGLIVSGAVPLQDQPIGLQAAQLGGVAPHMLMFGGTSDNALTLDNGHPAPFATGWTVYGVPDKYSNAPTLPGFLQEYQAANGGPPPASEFANAGNYYAPFLQLAESMQKAGSIDDIAKISAVMPSVSVPALIGTFRFNAKHVAQMVMQACALPPSATGPADISCTYLPTGG
jgi:branched-chain amino acid transport system substrate-binding protein